MTPENNNSLIDISSNCLRTNIKHNSLGVHVRISSKPNEDKK